ncbi:hypothetical protein D3C87_2108380 [compost metagenome]
MGIRNRLRRVGPRVVEDGLLDRLELPAVVLAADVDAQLLVIVFLAGNEGFGGGIGEVGIHIDPLFLPAGDGVRG